MQTLACSDRMNTLFWTLDRQDSEKPRVCVCGSLPQKPTYRQREAWLYSCNKTSCQEGGGVMRTGKTDRQTGRVCLGTQAWGQCGNKKPEMGGLQVLKPTASVTSRVLVQN